MNSNYGKSGSVNSFDFDLGLSSGRPRSLNDQKSQASTYSASSYTYSAASAPSKMQTTPSWSHQPNKPSWTHQPAAPSHSGVAGSLSGPTSMAGDIFGKSWGSSAPSGTSAVASSVGTMNKNPNLFGDLLNSAMGQNKGQSNVPLKKATPAASKSSFSMGGMADSLPKTASSAKSGGGWGTSGNSGSNASGLGGQNGTSNVNLSGSTSRSPNLGGPSMKSTGINSGGTVMGSNKDPFGSLVDFSLNPGTSLNSGNKASEQASTRTDTFGDFQAAPKVTTSSFSPKGLSTSSNSSMGASTGTTYSKIDDFGFPNVQSQPPIQSSGVTDFDSLFGSSTASSGSTGKVSEGFENQKFSGGEDWGLEADFGGGNDSSGTTEIEGLPPPPAGISAASAKDKGVDSQKQGQYADAIKWLSWAIVLLEKAGDGAGTAEALSCRASCYKEVGEYKKAVADCTKVLEGDSKNVAVLVQRALLYESMEKYKLGAEDLRTVMKLDPGNRVARTTIHRLNKMAD